MRADDGLNVHDVLGDDRLTSFELPLLIGGYFGFPELVAQRVAFGGGGVGHLGLALLSGPLRIEHGSRIERVN